MNFNSFTTSDNAMHSASVEDRTTLLIPLLLQAMGTPQSAQSNHRHSFLFLCHLHSRCHCMQPIPMFYASVVRILVLSFLLPGHNL